MIKLDRIVCPTDLSDDSERTIRYAAAITRASGLNGLFVIVRRHLPIGNQQRAQKDQMYLEKHLQLERNVSDDPGPIYVQAC